MMVRVTASSGRCAIRWCYRLPPGEAAEQIVRDFGHDLSLDIVPFKQSQQTFHVPVLVCPADDEAKALHGWDVDPETGGLSRHILVAVSISCSVSVVTTQDAAQQIVALHRASSRTT